MSATTLPVFEIARADGRSNAQVILDHVRNGEPGTIYTYGELAGALEIGAPHAYDRSAVRSIVVSLLDRLLKEQQRALHNVRNVGYRLAKASEHISLATMRQSRADVQWRHGLALLRNVRWNEMDDNYRNAHEGALMLIESQTALMNGMDQRLRRIEEAIKRAR